ncbi:hypothetical protein [Zooshikella ganghwensis]|uniref:DUF1269 domain-containing protein n=1 Tax=Zooshikella ganghwensis TaxID=202772 RepID=A0A4P9VP95_9GAMM|nr:hypothetical protein [Zooshikella ganghwensis]RDH44746.1 hypothetical protein B9G39_15615 [Zooshikella ganghwensis]
MKRLYYLADNIDDVERISEDLHAEGITNWRFHVLSRDDAGLYNHQLHAANPIQRCDMIHRGEQGAMIGLLAGCFAGYFALQLTPTGSDVHWMTFVAVIVLFTMFGTWVGGLAGLSHENYKINQFHDALDSGKYLIMVDARRHEEPRVRANMNQYHPEASYVGVDSVFTNPLAHLHPTNHL